MREEDKALLEDLQREYIPKYEEMNACKKKQKEIVKKAQLTKWIVGNHYILSYKRLDGSPKITREYILKKFIYKSRGNPLNIVIMKQVAGPMGKIFTLNREDCRKYHIKYEDGLEVYSMFIPFVAKTSTIKRSQEKYDYDEKTTMKLI
jgi:hypothetical protein